MISVEALERLHRIGREMSSLDGFRELVLSDNINEKVLEGDAYCFLSILNKLPESLRKPLLLSLHKTTIEFIAEQFAKYDEEYVIKNIFHPFLED